MPQKVSKMAMACQAMKEIGIAEAKTKAALKQLLETYAENWDFIEADGYKVLVEFIIDNEKPNEERVHSKGKGLLLHESKRVDYKNKQVPSYDATEVIEPPIKRYKTRQQKDQPLSPAEASESSMKIIPDLTFDEESEGSEDSQPLVRKPRQRHINLQQVCVTGNNIDLVRGDCPELEISPDLICDGNSKNSDGEDVMKYLPVELLNESNTVSVSDRCQIDIAASLPVKNPLISSSLQKSGFDLHKGEVSQEMMRERCIKLYRSGECHSTERVTEIKPESLASNEQDKGSKSSGLCMVEGGRNYRSSLRVTESSAFKIDDITRGEEKLKISLENGRNAELPTFSYIAQNIAYDKASVRFALAYISDEDCCSKCSGDCLKSSIRCLCSIANGGECAYTPGGLVKEKFLEECISIKREPKQHSYVYCKKCPPVRLENEKSSVACKGHLSRRFIKECWCKCSCNRSCGNRIVQKGIAVKLQVFFTPEGKGWGLRTLEDLPRGAFICEYVGEILTIDELHERNSPSAGKEHTYPVLLDADWGSQDVLKDEKVLCLDSTVYGNVARFINHRCSDATLVEIPVEVETPDHHYYHVALFTTRDVGAMEELTWDYGISFHDRDYPVKPFRCICGSRFCRDLKDIKQEITYVRRRRKEGKGNKKDGLLDHQAKDLAEGTPREEIQDGKGNKKDGVLDHQAKDLAEDTLREEIHVGSDALMQLEVVPDMGVLREEVQVAPHVSRQLEIVPSTGLPKAEIQVATGPCMQLQVISSTPGIEPMKAMECLESGPVRDSGSSSSTTFLAKEVSDLRAQLEAQKAAREKDQINFEAQLEAEKAAREKDFEAHRTQFQAVMQQLSTLLPGFQVPQAPLQMLQLKQNVDGQSHMSLG